MLYINGNTIKMTRGDTAHLVIPIILSDGSEYTMKPGDTLTLSCKKSIQDENYAFQKVIESGNTFHIQPDDTKNLEFGAYKYDIQLNTSNGDIYTVIDVSTFEILTEVTC